MSRCLLIVALLAFAVADVSAAETTALVASPFMELVRDRAVHRELGLTSQEVATVRGITDRLDAELFSTRNQPEKERRKNVAILIARTRALLKPVLTTQQLERLGQIEVQCQGFRAVLRPDVHTRLLLSSRQLEQVIAMVNETDREIDEAYKKVQKGSPRKTVKKEAARIRNVENRRIKSLLTANQRRRWGDLRGRPFKTAGLGQGMKYKAPEFPEGLRWINSPPQKLASLKGKVVVVHFYAFG